MSEFAAGGSDTFSRGPAKDPNSRCLLQVFFLFKEIQLMRTEEEANQLMMRYTQEQQITDDSGENISEMCADRVEGNDGEQSADDWEPVGLELEARLSSSR